MERKKASAAILLACILALGKLLFAEEVYAGWLLPRVTFGKGFARSFRPFAECPWHSV